MTSLYCKDFIQHYKLAIVCSKEKFLDSYFNTSAAERWTNKEPEAKNYCPFDCKGHTILGPSTIKFEKGCSKLHPWPVLCVLSCAVLYLFLSSNSPQLHKFPLSVLKTRNMQDFIQNISNEAAAVHRTYATDSNLWLTGAVVTVFFLRQCWLWITCDRNMAKVISFKFLHNHWRVGLYLYTTRVIIHLSLH